MKGALALNAGEDTAPALSPHPALDWVVSEKQSLAVL